MTPVAVNAAFSDGAGMGFLHSPFPLDSDSIKSCLHIEDTPDNGPDYHWATFITAYALGRWDPHRTPNPPRSYLSHHVSDSGDIPTASTSFGPDISLSTRFQSIGKSTRPFPIPRPEAISCPIQQPSRLSRCRGVAPTRISLPLPNTHTYLSASAPSSEVPTPSLVNNTASNAEVRTTAATLRWAASTVNIAPLALPSPEHELTDPMRGVIATVPGSLQDLHPRRPDISPATLPRKPRLGSFWEGTTDVEKEDDPTSDVSAAPDWYSSTVCLDHIDVPSMQHPHAASAPLEKFIQCDSSADDYFGAAAYTGNIVDTPSGAIDEPTPLPAPTAVSVPPLPRRVCLTRQTSSPLPVSFPREQAYASGRGSIQGISSIKAARAAKEEQMFAELGFLAPPNPPEELERRRALYKFNLLHTGPDVNFDRITHLSKLVFSAKGVVISLIDGHEQWFKSQWGVKAPGHSRSQSFCAHAILQRGDEPTVILDTHLDWRFAKNPLVLGKPSIRFYAGAPLRTQDGYNIGTLAIFDDSPRKDFSPRHRHTLKEFAAITMREMELWKDKIQLRIRDRIQNSMEQFSQECLEIDTEAHSELQRNSVDAIVGSSMDKVYDRAAKLVKRTLDVEGVIVMDVSHCDVAEMMRVKDTVSVIMHYGDPHIDAKEQQLSVEEYHKMNSFFAKYPDGKISEGIVPPCFRPFLPTHIQYALTVPIFNIGKRPFALLCAYNVSDQTKRYLEGHELSYLRAIGVIILSAVLKRRMILADKAKSLFISNISHELRTPLHGILAAAELLGDTSLNQSQMSFLRTVQACGNSLEETVNHVLDFTKLSGMAKTGSAENIIVPMTVDLSQLVEEAVDGCWIGHRARIGITGNSGIGSVYSPPREEDGSLVTTWKMPVETIIDIGYRDAGWTLKCQKGGIRRVLMNVFGNSLKFTEKGFIHVMLREVPLCEGDPPKKIKIELAVKDSGKGISQNFLKNQLFHPFSQENPLQTGTGLGLAIVNSIVTSESVAGKVDVWSEEGIGTEIKVTFFADPPDDGQGSCKVMEPLHPTIQPPRKLKISLIGFDEPHEGVKLFHKVVQMYVLWWGFDLHSGPGYGDIAIVNDHPSIIDEATKHRETRIPFVLLSASRGNSSIMAIASEHEHIGGFCRILFKPGGPSRLRTILELSLSAINLKKSGAHPPCTNPHKPGHQQVTNNMTLPTGKFMEKNCKSVDGHLPATQTILRDEFPSKASARNVILDCESVVSTVAIGSNGSLLKTSAIGTLERPKRCFRVLVVEDNEILRNLLIKWLTQKGYDFRDAVDGHEGVTLYETDGPFDVVLLDLSMPVLDGVAATTEIRRFESALQSADKSSRFLRTARILALTGMSSLEDKQRAFEAGVDGYLVKPVAFKTLDEIFHKLEAPRCS